MQFLWSPPARAEPEWSWLKGLLALCGVWQDCHGLLPPSQSCMQGWLASLSLAATWDHVEGSQQKMDLWKILKEWRFWFWWRKSVNTTEWLGCLGNTRQNTSQCRVTKQNVLDKQQIPCFFVKICSNKVTGIQPVALEWQPSICCCGQLSVIKPNRTSCFGKLRKNLASCDKL